MVGQDAHMTKVAATGFASDLYALHAKAVIFVTLHCIWQIVIEARPTAAG
jgi:hypothetical protein